jgi:hypothetical protein
MKDSEDASIAGQMSVGHIERKGAEERQAARGVEATGKATTWAGSNGSREVPAVWRRGLTIESGGAVSM